MAVLHSVVLQNATGDKQTGKDVKLYNYGDTPGVDTPIGTYTDNLDGSYTLSVSSSGKYSVAVEGTIQDELDGIYIVADDLASEADLTSHTGAANPHSGSASTSDVNTVQTNLDNHKNADGDGGSSAPGTNKEHNAKAIALADSAGHFAVDDVESAMAAIADMLGSGAVAAFDLSDTNFLTAVTNILTALRTLDGQAYKNSIVAGGVATEQNRRIWLKFTYDGALPTGVLGNMNHETGISAGDTPFPLIRGGSITAVAVAWASGTITGSDQVQFAPAIFGSSQFDAGVQVLTDDVADKIKIAYFNIGTMQFESGTKLGCVYAKSNTATLTDVVVIVEITISAL